jgi:MFS family permease
LAAHPLSPIIPLTLPQLGVGSPKGIDIWSGIITGSTSFGAASALPVWGCVAGRHKRKLSLLHSSFAIALFTCLMGLFTNVWQFFGARAVMGAFAGVFLCHNCAGSQPGARTPAEATHWVGWHQASRSDHRSA